jgi:hypothetical protein
MEDIRVDSWIELENVLYALPKTYFQRHRSDFAYRGLADESWDLKSSLIRLGGDYADLEEPLLRSFRKYAEPGSLPSTSIWVQLAVAQHHGLPTRLLDWTLSPRIAVHFATAEEDYFDRDGVVWCLDMVQARELLPTKLKEILAEKWAYICSVEMLDDLVPSLDVFDKLVGRQPFVVFFEPPSIDGRIVNQAAVLSVLPDRTLSLSDFLENQPDLVRRVIIPKELKWEVRDKLDQDNVTERMLFPGLDGLCTWLKRYYGPGPTRRSPITPAT